MVLHHYPLRLVQKTQTTAVLANQITGGPSSSCELIILQNKSHGEIISLS